MATNTGTTMGIWEYGTYAPEGRHCSACMHPIKTLEPVRRGVLERASGAPIVIYRHAYPCPQTER